ncbi:hypothetical protein Goshw_018946 [Gossypium schwendimanii]|uniref:Uncharacterized protein n=3 Tax=Gossypium TaxID=3633 RepID=A0A7J9LQI0_GOSSC|nr:hypothetical protein [Gossypium schwendimanii]
MCKLTKTASLPNLRAHLRALHYAIFVNGKFCKDPKLATLEDFLLGLNIRGNTSNRVRSVATPANDEQIPGLNTVGTLRVGFTTSNPDNHLFTKVLNPRDAFVFPIDPAIYSDVLAKAFQMDNNIINQIRSNYVSLPLPHAFQTRNSVSQIKIESFEESTKAEAMGEMTQEPGFEIPNQEEDDLKLQEPINLSLLHLDNFKNNQQNRHSCTTCACNVTASNPMKRPSPESIAEHKSKKPLLENHYSLSGFSKIPLPLLQRSTSDPYTPTKPSLSDTAKALEDTPLSKGSASSSLPPRAPVLSRSISDPIFSPAKSLSRSSSSYEMGVELIKEESPSAKRLKRMKERMKEMSNWWGEAMREVEDVLCTTEAIKDNGEPDCEEAVRVEKIGECLDLHFKCPCGKGYKILLSGKNCYYKLI